MPDGLLRQKAATTQLMALGTANPLAAGACTCCSITPSAIPVTAFVETGETQTITGTGGASFPVAPFVAAGPGATAWGNGNWTYGPAQATFAFIMSGKVATPAGMTDNGGGLNLYQLLHLTVAFGTATADQYWEFSAGITWPQTVTMSCSIPARLCTKITEIGRFNRNVSPETIWGPYPDALHQPGGALDLQGYRVANLGWYYWSPDGPGSVTITAAGHTLTLAGAGPATLIGPGSATLNNGNAGGDPYGPFTPVTLQAQFWGSSIPNDSNTVWFDPPTDTRGASMTLTGGDTLAGLGASSGGGSGTDAQRFDLTFNSLQPDRTVTFTGHTLKANGAAWGAGVFPVETKDGPLDSSGGTSDSGVNTDWPVAETITGSGPHTAAAGVPISFSSPGSFTGTGHQYSYSVNCQLNGASTTVRSFSADTIGAQDPAFGFAYSTAGLNALNQPLMGWRFPLRIPAAAATWNAIRLTERAAPVIGAPSWTAGAGTSIDGSGNVTGAGTLTITRTLDAASGIHSARWFRFGLKGSVAAQVYTATIGTKSWTLTGTDMAWDTILMDLCGPTNASGYDHTSGRLEIAAGAQGGSGWGVEPSITITVTTAHPFQLDLGSNISKGSGTALVQVSEVLAGQDSRFWTNLYADTVTPSGKIYSQRGMLYAPEGRIAYDLEYGRIAYLDSARLPTYEDFVYITQSLQDLVAQAAAQDGGYGLAQLTSLKAPSGGIRAGWAGGPDWWAHDDWFSNQAESWRLTPAVMRVVPPASSIVLTADYCVDRVTCGTGVSCNLTSQRIIGGGFHGIVDNSAMQPVPENVDTELADPAMSLSDGQYTLPASSDFLVGTTYHLTGTGGVTFRGAPAGTITPGNLERYVVENT